MLLCIIYAHISTATAIAKRADHSRVHSILTESGPEDRQSSCAARTVGTSDMESTESSRGNIRILYMQYALYNRHNRQRKEMNIKLAQMFIRQI